MCSFITEFCLFVTGSFPAVFWRVGAALHSVNSVMAGLPPQHNNPAQLGGNKPILLQLEEQYTKRVDDDVLKLVDSFADIVRVTEVSIGPNTVCKPTH